MRSLFGALAVILGLVSIALAARYGYRGADTEIDGIISAVVFGAIALCAFVFDGATVRLWFRNHRPGAVLIGAIAAAALVVTFTNSLGAIAGRADATQAERAKIKAEVAADRAKLKRLDDERGRLTAFVPATNEDVHAARDAVLAAERIRAAECDKRGPRCRERETEEQVKRDALAAAMANRAATSRAAALDTEVTALRTQLAKAQPVQAANPLGEALEQIIGATAAALTAWQQAIVAAVFELCLVGVMVIFELLGHTKGPSSLQTEPRSAPAESVQSPAPTGAPAPGRRPGSPASPKVATGSVKSFVREVVAPADGERVEVKALARDYRSWCETRGLAPLELGRFLDEIEKLCGKLGIDIAVADDRRVYCLNVKLDSLVKPIAAP